MVGDVGIVNKAANSTLGETPVPPGAKRVSVVFAPQTYAKIVYIAEQKGTNKTEALRQSVFLTEHLIKAAKPVGSPSCR